MFINQTTEEVVLRSVVAVFDWDGVIQDITIPWYRNALLNKDLFGYYLDLDENISIEELQKKIFGRESYELINCLIQKNMTRAQVPKDIVSEFYKLYTDDPNFYKKCPILNGFTIAKSMLEQDNHVRSVTFLTHYINEEEGEKKRERFERFFSDFSNAKFVAIPSGQSKARWINENVPNWTLIVDDAPHVLLDIITNCDCKNRTVLYPRYGYNKTFEANNNTLLSSSEVEIATYNPKLGGIIK